MKLRYILILLLLSLPTITLAKEMQVFDPPSNIRDKPDGKVLCQITENKNIETFGEKDDWVFTDVCGVTGVIHKSQLKELSQSDSSSSLPPAATPELDDLVKKVRDEIDRVRAAPPPAPVPAPAPVRKSSACDSLYVEQEFREKGWAGYRYRVLSINPITEKVVLRYLNYKSGTLQLSCDTVIEGME